MPIGPLADPHLLDAIVTIAGALAILVGLVCANMAAPDRRRGRDR
jgi:hypothetical protein